MSLPQIAGRIRRLRRARGVSRKSERENSESDREPDRVRGGKEGEGGRAFSSSYLVWPIFSL